ncbi:hypothetical protein GW17_00003561 [Ensete ventricosum]|nr:hypothetical protein GW17_00003561 [Ensete ventricosum]
MAILGGIGIRPRETMPVVDWEIEEERAKELAVGSVGPSSGLTPPVANDKQSGDPHPRTKNTIIFSSSNFLGRSSGSSRRAAVSSSRDMSGVEADQSRSRTADASPGTFRKVSSARRSSPIGSMEHRYTSGRNVSAIKNYESTLKGIEALNFDGEERKQL